MEDITMNDYDYNQVDHFVEDSNYHQDYNIDPKHLEDEHDYD